MPLSVLLEKMIDYLYSVIDIGHQGVSFKQASVRADVLCSKLTFWNLNKIVEIW